MADNNETVEQVYTDVIYKIGFVKDGESEKTSLSVVVNRFHEAHKRELDAKDAEIARLKRKNFDLNGFLLTEQELVEKRNALIKELADALECAVSGFSQEVVTYGEAFALITKARKVVK